MTKEVLTTIFTAVTAEAAPLAHRLRLARDSAGVWSGPAPAPGPGPGGGSCMPLRLVVTGMGRANLRRAAQREFAEHRPQRVVMFGVAGAVCPQLSVADVIVPAQVIDLRDGRVWTPTAAPAPAWHASTTPHRLGTVDEVACDAAAKMLLRSRHAVDAIDMETAELAAIAQEHDVPWVCVRGISDDAAGSIPGFALDLTDHAGHPRVARAAMRVLAGPWRLPALLRLGRDTHRAAAAAAQRVLELL